MRRFLAALAAIGVLGIALPATAGLLGLRRFGESTEKIAAQTLASQRTLAIASEQLTGYDVLILWVDIYDANDSETGVQVECKGQQAGGGNEFTIPGCENDTTNARYNCEPKPLFWNPSDETSSNNKRQMFRLTTLGATNAKCYFTFTGGSADDTITVDVFAAVSG